MKKLGLDYIKHPLLSREGGNIAILRGRQCIAEEGWDCGHGGFVYQGLYDLPDEFEFDGEEAWDSRGRRCFNLLVLLAEIMAMALAIWFMVRVAGPWAVRALSE